MKAQKYSHINHIATTKKSFRAHTFGLLVHARKINKEKGMPQKYLLVFLRACLFGGVISIICINDDHRKQIRCTV